jgi:hypothetical protein
MAKRKKLDEKSLLEMIDNGDIQADIMKTFGFKNSSQLKVAYANALMNSGKATKLKGGRKKVAAAPTTISVNKRGSLVIPRAMVENFGLQTGDCFEVKNTKAGIRLASIK